MEELQDKYVRFDWAIKRLLRQKANFDVLEGFLVSNNIMPIGSILLAVFCCYKVGWGWDKFLEEANEGKGLKVQHWMKPVFKYFVPAAVLFIYVYGIVNFAWK